MKPSIFIIIILTAALSLGGAATIRRPEIPVRGSPPDIEQEQEAPKSEAETEKAQAEAQRLQTELQSAQDAGQKAQGGWDQQHSRGGGGGSGAMYGFGGGGQAMYADRFQGTVGRADRSSGKTLVIRTSETDPKDQATLEEDLAVMSHILDKTLSEESGAEARTWKAMGINVFLPGSTPFHSMFLDGYGALFMLKVNFPLLPAPAKSEEQKEKSPVDSTWAEAREELYGQHSEGQFAMGAMGAVEEYSAEKVSKLKEGLLEALKNAANIRELKSDDSITVCVFGGPSAAPAAVKYRAASKRPPAPAGGSYEAVALGHSASPMRGTIMTLRVKKSDADAFAHGNLKLDDFRKKARISIYAGGDTSGGNVSWFGTGY